MSEHRVAVAFVHRRGTLPLVASLLLFLTGGAAPAREMWQAKVAPDLLDRLLATGAREEVLVVLADQADLGPAAAIHGKQRKGRFVFERLRQVAGASQPRVLAELAAYGVEARPFWIVNMVQAHADATTIRRLASLPEVVRIAANPSIAVPLPEAGLVAPRNPDGAVAIEQNLVRIGVPDTFWAKGFTGQGAVVGGLDTGVSWRHRALKDSYRGSRGGEVVHDYNWHDAIHVSDGRCGGDSPEPCDDGRHGTHTMGIMVGRDGAANQIGVAPGAQWIGCRNMELGAGTPATYTECFEWMLAPTDRNGDHPDPTRSPDVVSNSWICPPFEGCGDPTILDRVIESLRAAGIVVIAGAGNDGPDCSSLSMPPSIVDAAFTVGAVREGDDVASWSSRGPVTSDGSGRLKPDLLAPGYHIRSSMPGNTYENISGTSMAAPHVAGMVALLISAGECMRGDVDAIEAHLREHALPRTDSQMCGGISGDQIPNPIYGYGVLRSALPNCPAGIGGYADGMETRRLVCRDRDGGGKAGGRLGGGPAWQCDGEGFHPDAGDRVVLRLDGQFRDAGVGGTVRELELERALCRNASTGQRVDAVLLGEGEWDCAAAGLVGEPGDVLVEVLLGVAKSR